MERAILIDGSQAQWGEVLHDQSFAALRDTRGRGLMWGVELRDAAQADAVVKAALRLGLIILQTGRSGNVISIAPPLVIDREDLNRALDILEAALTETGESL